MTQSLSYRKENSTSSHLVMQIVFCIVNKISRATWKIYSTVVVLLLPLKKKEEEMRPTGRVCLCQFRRVHLSINIFICTVNILYA